MAKEDEERINSGFETNPNLPVAPQDSVDHAKPHEQMSFGGLPRRLGGR
jgi:hypothetical protein